MRRFIIGLLVILAVAFAALVAFDRFAPHAAAQLAVDLEHSRSGLEAKRMTVEGFDLAYLEGGEGEPLLLVHGFGANKDNFTRAAGSLTPHYRVLIPDLPGFGNSAKPMDADYSIPAQVEYLRTFARAHGIERVHLGGSSMGGWISVEWALHYPEEIASLWLLGPAGTDAALESEMMRITEETGETPLLAETPEDYATVLDLVMAKPPFMPYSVRRVLAERAVADHALHARIFDLLNDPVQTPRQDERIEGLATPALVVWGEDDRVLTADAAAVYQAAMPNAEVVMLPGIGHLPMLEAPGRVTDDYLAFRDRMR